MRSQPNSGSQAIQNADNAGDRAILNPAEIGRVGSAVDFVSVGVRRVTSSAPIDPGCPRGSANAAGQVAQNPNARYVQAQFGTFPAVGRNSFGSPGINIWNIWLFKNTKLSEGATLQLRLDAFSIFSHRNFSLAQPSVFQAGDLIGAVNNVLSQTYAERHLRSLLQ